MGIIQKIKNFFKKSINIDDVSDDCLVFQAVNNVKLKINTPLHVKDDFVAVLVCKDKVLDTYIAGEYRLTPNSMPLLSRYLKLTRPDKKGNLPNKFLTSIYFVNLKEFFGQAFVGSDYVITKSNKFKNIQVKVKGEYDCKIYSPVDFMDALMSSCGTINDKIAKEELSFWVGTIAVRKIQKNKPEVELLYERDSKCFEGLNDYVDKEIKDCGIKITKINVTETIFPKKIYKNVTLSYKELHEPQQAQFIGETNVGKNPVKVAQQVSFENESKQIYKEEADEIEAQSNNLSVVISNADVRLKGDDEGTNVILESEKLSNSDIYSQTILKDGEIVTSDKKPDEPIIKKVIEYKKCNKCGAFNSLDSKVCYNCKSIFVSKDK